MKGFTCLEKDCACKIIEFIKDCGDSLTVAKEEEFREFFQYIDVNRGSVSSFFHYLAKKGRPVGLVRVLKDLGADFNFQTKNGFCNTPLLWAIANGNFEIAREIIDLSPENANFNLQGLGNTPLHLAIAKGYKSCTYDGRSLTVSSLDLVKQLVSKTDPNKKGELGNTPLHLACVRRDPEMIRLVLEEGGDLSIQNDRGETPLCLLKKTYEEAYQILERTSGGYCLLNREEQATLDKECQRVIEAHQASWQCHSITTQFPRSKHIIAQENPELRLSLAKCMEFEPTCKDLRADFNLQTRDPSCNTPFLAGGRDLSVQNNRGEIPLCMSDKTYEEACQILDKHTAELCLLDEKKHEDLNKECQSQTGAQQASWQECRGLKTNRLWMLIVRCCSAVHRVFSSIKLRASTRYKELFDVVKVICYSVFRKKGDYSS